MGMKTSTRSLLGLVAWLCVCFAAAAVGGVASVAARDFYAQLSRPAWAPPGWLFAPMWTTLYTLMALAAWAVWKVQGFRGAIVLFVVQLAANALWTWLFFVWRLGAVAFAEVVLLWLLILCTMVAFWRVRRWAAWALVPYLAWVSLACALTYSVWRRNPQMLG